MLVQPEDKSDQRTRSAMVKVSESTNNPEVNGRNDKYLLRLRGTAMVLAPVKLFSRLSQVIRRLVPLMIFCCSEGHLTETTPMITIPTTILAILVPSIWGPWGLRPPSTPKPRRKNTGHTQTLH